MTDRINSIIVVLDKDLRTDDAEPILEAIRQLRGVLLVTPKVSQGNDFFAEQRVKRQLLEKLMELLND